MARGRRGSVPRKPFDEAFDKISDMEARVCYSSVTTAFDVVDIVKWLYPPEVVRALMAAYPYSGRGNPYRDETVNIFNDPDLLGETQPGSFVIHYDPDLANMVLVKGGLMELQEDTCGIVSAMFEYQHIHNEWDVVRKVVHWMNDNATAGCARYFFPALGNFLPANHAFHALEGTTKFSEPKASITGIAPFIRIATETVAAALFAPVRDRELTGVGLTVNGPPSTPSKSQRFKFC